MSNLTIAIDDATVRQARIRAIQEGTSVSAKVREFLSGYARGEPPADGAARAGATSSAPYPLPVFAGGAFRVEGDAASNAWLHAEQEADDIARLQRSFSPLPPA